jgi:hypothetical protein
MDQGRQAGDKLDPAIVSSVPSERSTLTVEPAGLQPGQPAAAHAAEENRPLVADKLAGAASENRREAGQARPLLLAAAGGESPHAAAVWEHAAQDRGAADAFGLALPWRLQNLEPKEEGRHSV